jgi:hypothetical protein
MKDEGSPSSQLFKEQGKRGASETEREAGAKDGKRLCRLQKSSEITLAGTKGEWPMKERQTRGHNEECSLRNLELCSGNNGQSVKRYKERNMLLFLFYEVTWPL